MTYTLSDGGSVSETYDSLDDAIAAAADWYDYMVDEDRIAAADMPHLDTTDIHCVVGLNEAITAWEEKIAEALGSKSWAGHGSYYVSAASEAGLCLSAESDDS